MKLNKLIKVLALVGLLGSGAAQAALVDRGGGMIYDDVLNVTWLQDANYAKTSGYDADGAMTWSQAMTWADNLVYGGYSDWRLPSAAPANGVSWVGGNPFDGTGDYGFNITRPTSELSYMYYVNLGLLGVISTSGSFQIDWWWITRAALNEAGGIGLVNNLGSMDFLMNYWYGTTSDPYHSLCPTFTFYQGRQLQVGCNQFYQDAYYAWAVRDGDVASTVPEPGSALLVGLGLAGLAATRRRRALGAA